MDFSRLESKYLQRPTYGNYGFLESYAWPEEMGVDSELRLSILELELVDLFIEVSESI